MELHLQPAFHRLLKNAATTQTDNEDFFTSLSVPDNSSLFLNCQAPAKQGSVWEIIFWKRPSLNHPL
jgi:hypothetical protein